MLREVKIAHLRPRIIPIKFTNSGTLTINNGSRELTGVRNSTGDVTLTMSEPFARTPIMLSNIAGTNGANGGYSSTAATASTFNNIARNQAGTVTDSDIQGLIFGFDSSSSTTCQPQLVKATQNLPRIELFQVNTTTSTIVIGASKATLVKNGTGDVTLTLKNAFRSSEVTAFVAIVGATTLSPRTVSATPTTINIKIFDTASTAAEGIVNIAVFGWDCKEPTQKGESILQSSQRKPRMLLFQVVAASSTLSIGSEDGTCVRNNGGDYTMTFLKPFRREPLCFPFGATTGSANRIRVVTQSSTSVNIINESAGGGGSDTNHCGVLVFGFDDPSQY